MKHVILYKSDFANGDLGMSWEGLLDAVGIETHILVGGRYVDREIEEVELVVSKAIPNLDHEEDSIAGWENNNPAVAPLIPRRSTPLRRN